MIADVLVVGTGPSGVHAASVCAARGLRVTIVDVGYDDEATRAAIPAGNFRELRRTDAGQSRYFLGNLAADIAGVRVGAQLTPPRQFITRDAETLAPIDAPTFAAMQSFAAGGLGAGWGAGSYSYNDRELAEIGLPVAAMTACYNDVAAAIGIAAPEHDDTSAELNRFRPLQPPHELDTNCAAVFAAYERRRARVRGLGLAVGRAPGAILSAPLGSGADTRDANPLDDMDFYSDASRSVYRPRYTLEAICRLPNVTRRSGALVTHFVTGATGVDVHVRDVRTGATEVLACRRLVLAAGAIGTSRIALRSLGIIDRDVPILSNAYAYVPCVNLAMLGRPARTERHSLAQLSGVFAEAGADRDNVLLSIFSYRSLLLFKLVKEMPLPPQLGVLTARLLLSALTIVGVHQPDRRTPHKTMRMSLRDGAGRLAIAYQADASEQAGIDRRLATIRRALRAMGCVPMGTILPGHGSSIHYAGAFAIGTDRSDPLGTDADGALYAAPPVSIADSANWRFLPAKGLTMTLMANARRVAAAVCEELTHA
jgi:hypothetical protein